MKARGREMASEREKERKIDREIEYREIER